MKSLTRAEEQVMQLLWNLREGFLKDLVESSPEPKPHANTVATILKILVEKGYVQYEVQGRNNLYKPKITKEDYGKKSVNQLMKGYFDGSAAKLVSHFVSDNKLSVEELEALLKQLRSSKKNEK